MKRTLLLLCFSGLLSFSEIGCSQNDEATPQATIEEGNWKLVAIRSEDKMMAISTSSYVTSSSYILSFRDSSLFQFNTSVNAAAGNYLINGNKIELSNYQELTEVVAINQEQQEVDAFLLENLIRVAKYVIVRNELVLYLENGELTFRRI